MNNQVSSERYSEIFKEVLERGIAAGLPKEQAAVQAIHAANSGKVPEISKNDSNNNDNNSMDVEDNIENSQIITTEIISNSNDNVDIDNLPSPPLLNVDKNNNNDIEPPSEPQTTSSISTQSISAKSVEPVKRVYINATIVKIMIEEGKKQGNFRKLTSLINEVFGSIDGLKHSFNPSFSSTTSLLPVKSPDDHKMNNNNDNNNNNNNNEAYNINNILNCEDLLETFNAIMSIPQDDLGYKVLCYRIQRISLPSRLFCCWMFQALQHCP